MARACEDLFGRSEKIQQFLADFAEKNKEAATGFTAAVKKVLAKIKEFFENLMFGAHSRTLEAGIIRKCGADVLKGLTEQYEKTFFAALEGNAARNATGEFEQGGERFSIVELDNGMQYVEATENQVIKGNDSTQWAQQVADYINKVIRGGQDFIIKTTQGDYLTITRDTAYKAGFRNQVRNPDGTYRTMTDAEYKVKLNAEIHINELAQVSRKTNNANVPDYKNHRFAKDGFTYRTAYFKDFDGKYYKLTISVGENGSVSTVYNVGKIKEDTLPSGKIKSTFSGSKANNVSPTNQYITKSPKVNPKPQKKSGNATTELNSDPEDDIGNRTFSYGELVAKGEVKGVIVGNQQQAPLTPDGKINTEKLLEIVRSKCSAQEKKGATTAYYVGVKDIGENVEIIRDGVLHRFAKARKQVGAQTWNALLMNARVTLELPQILSKAIEVNRSARGNNPDVPYTHVMMGTVALEDHKGGLEYFAVRFMVQERLNQPPYLSEMEIVGRLTSTNAKK